MKVGDLRRLFDGCDDDDVVIIATSDGKQHSPVYDAWEGVYAAVNSWSGRVYPRQSDDKSELCESPIGLNAVILNPIG